ncbi:hypothetical protein E1281_09905 [Actinomadura sp. KC345]|uniref:hypothetical protein n=1 Tax=Actinomadura sp. KC345 TaxID=2530371 RepID=UPI00104D498B|nr:hypothetical protein [Actinomadura sp. KC345]TDC55944.1 hypothetical protein E1281_09905 [Actinomadura sp. KC345]
MHRRALQPPPKALRPGLHDDSFRYSDTVDIDAGFLTGLVALAAVGSYRFRQRRWQRLVHPATT